MENGTFDWLIDLSKDYKENYLAHISIDCVVFGFHEASLKVLLARIKNADEWGLPGGYLRKEEDLHAAAGRILEERTGATNVFLTHFNVYGTPNRSQAFFEKYPDDLWNKQRFLSIAYYALIDYETVDPRPGELSDEVGWMDLDDLPPLMMDHHLILQDALAQLRKDLNYKPVGFNLLPEKFTMPELQKMYETILDKKLNRGNFYRKMMRYGILKKLNETRKGGAHKAPDLYSFDGEKYNKALQNGLQESW